MWEVWSQTRGRKTTVRDGLSLGIIAFLAIKYGRDIIQDPTYNRLLRVRENILESKYDVT